ncbi:hypothetical protein BGW37DRAFT_1921 [Umbelopsis sp. PMI_123]|nr:hypothetical protein BGW37DRAFT_1921 [Umbelopsis sp. PMI_123]
MSNEVNATYCEALQGPRIYADWISETAVYSFDALTYLYFILAFLLFPYPAYRVIAHKFNWEVNTKTLARHWSDIMLGLSYGCIVFVFGNYAKAFSWITVVAFYPSLFGYALIAELPFTKTSLPRIKSWPIGMWIVFLLALAVILAFAAFHIYLAATLPLPFVIYYVCALAIPLFLMLFAVALVYESQHNIIMKSLIRIKASLTSCKGKSSHDSETLPDIEGEQVGESSTAKDVHGTSEAPIEDLFSPVSMHLHHWQIFYVLCFFTRFDHPVSQVAAGIVLACYMEGICAYGYDSLVNDA